MYGIMFLIAPLVSAFYNEPSLTLLLQVAGFRVVLAGLTTCHISLLEKKMAFRKASLVQLPSFVLGAALAIWMAWSGYGAWSLVALSLFTGAFAMITAWIVSGWVPRFRFRRESFREIAGFGLNRTGESLIEVIFSNLYVLVIGTLFSPVQVGHYNRAQQFQNLPSTSINTVFNRVLMPMFSSIHGDHKKLRAGYIQALTLVSMASFPVLAGMSALAHPMVICLVGQKWEPCVPYLKILCLYGAFLPIHSLNVLAMLSQGKSGLSFKISIYKKLMVVAALLSTMHLGIIAMLWGQVVVGFLAIFVNAWPNRRLFGISIGEQFRVFTPYLILAVVMAFLVCWINTLVPMPAAVQLATGVIVGIVIYGIGLRLLNRPAHRQIADLTGSIPCVGHLAKLVFASPSPR
jgi:O-antigen/teichoic acid export membrane protein